jgi:hypothetical protein
MDNEYQSFPEYSKEDLDQAYETALKAAEYLHKKLTSLAEDSGYVVRAISEVKPQLDWLYAQAQNNPSGYPIVASGIEFLRGFSSELNRISGLTDDFSKPFDSMVNSTGTFVTTTSASASYLNPHDPLFKFTLPPHQKAGDHYSEKLRGLNPTLANTYDQVWQTYFATTSEPHRAALFMMRTLFDNFFAWLAPDDDIRNSRYWHKKTGDKQNQIWRIERLMCAIDRHIKDNDRRNILEAEAKQINVLYEAANNAHSRGALDEDKASKTLMAMDSFLKDWLDSLV